MARAPSPRVAGGSQSSATAGRRGRVELPLDRKRRDGNGRDKRDPPAYMHDGEGAVATTNYHLPTNNQIQSQILPTTIYQLSTKFNRKSIMYDIMFVLNKTNLIL